MLKLVKNTSNENYPITPQTSAVRKLTVKGIVNAGADLYDSYLVVKNSLTTTLNGNAVVRNVGWGTTFNQNSTWMYPSTCQIKYATLKIDGQVIEYNEDVNVRAVNMDVYECNAEKRRKYANTGAYGFQRLESGPRAPLSVPTVNTRTQGAYLSPFLSETVVAGAKTAASYGEVSSIIYLSDIFKFCDSLDTKALYMGGKEITVELQFENYNTVLTEFVNYATDLTTTANAPNPFPSHVLATTANTIAPAAVTAAIGDVRSINTVSTYLHVSQVPLYVGQPICLWLAAAAPAIVGSNYALITGLSVPPAGGVCSVSFKQYNSVNGPLRTAGTNVTSAQFSANFFAGGVGVCVGITGVNDPVLVANVNSLYTNIDAGASSQYTVNGVDMVIVELPTLVAQKNTVNFTQFMRDTDVIPQGQLNYNKSFMTDPNTVAVYAMFPPKATAASPQTNLLSLSRNNGNLAGAQANVVSDGLSYRCLLNNQQLYTRDIAFGTNDSVEPLYYHRLGLASMNVGTMLNNLSLSSTFMATDGNTCHAMIAEPVQQMEQQQQFNLRLVFTTNASDRTIYLYKAIKQQLTF